MQKQAEEYQEGYRLGKDAHMMQVQMKRASQSTPVKDNPFDKNTPHYEGYIDGWEAFRK